MATHFVGDDENNQQGAEEVLLSVIDGLDDEKLPGFALRLALTGHVDIPREGEIDHLDGGREIVGPCSAQGGSQKTYSQSSEKASKRKGKIRQEKDRQESRSLNHGWGQQWPLHSRGGDMLQFTYKLKITERVKGKCISPSPLQP